MGENLFMMIGEYIYSIDDKKRLLVPAKFRPSLGKKAIMTRGIDNCLVIYPLTVWGELTKKWESLPTGQVDARGFTRILLSGATEVELDKLGRALVPDHLKDYAFLKKNVVIIGLSNRIEIWDDIRWKEYKGKMEKTVSDMAGQLGI